MPPTTVTVADDAGVRTLTLDRPAALNSFDAGLHADLLQSLDAAADDAAVRCVVLAGAGRAFCAGQDLSEPDASPGQDLGALIERHYAPLVRRLRSMPVPVVAAVHGVAAGAGASLALNCDIVVAARSASFIQAFSRIGLVPDTAATWLLPQSVGRARALGLALLGDRLPAAEAERIGLIWQCVDDAELAATVRALAARLAAMPSRALAATRRAIDAALAADTEAALRHETAAQRALGHAADFREGVAAFADKRPPVFGDR